jgi:hypothetical protein
LYAALPVHNKSADSGTLWRESGAGKTTSFRALERQTPFNVEPNERMDADLDDILLDEEEGRLVDSCSSDDDEAEVTSCPALLAEEIEVAEEQATIGSPKSSVAEVHDFLHHLSELQLFYKVQSSYASLPDRAPLQPYPGRSAEAE